MLRIPLSLICILTTIVLKVDANEPPPRVFVQWDNDLLSGSDRDYTNGARVAFVQDLDPNQKTHNFLQKSLYRLTGAAGGGLLDDYRFNDVGSTRFSWGVGVTQLMFTPDDFSTPAAPQGERPYAGWAGLEFSLHVKNDHSASSVTLALGTTGPNSYAGDSQTWVHENLSGSPLYQGWDSQVPGELTVNLHFDHKRRIDWLDCSIDWPIELDGYTEWGAALGNFRTDAYLGGVVRAGYNLPASYATPRVQIGSYGHAVFADAQDDDDPFSIFGFAGARGSAVLHDITLDGPVFRDFDTGVDREPFVGELLVGVGISWGNIDLSLSQTLRTDEFKGQDKNQIYGSVMLRAQWPF
ncbi:MAG: lipid A deacylase LpxR family protein [Opitutales bacterium]|nr:lipid A deacylase LpxR family protein [Opitutales bacterium]MDP4693422.1 lipid A deacylase LpxR family protein [Opitutales bacterium]